MHDTSIFHYPILLPLLVAVLLGLLRKKPVAMAWVVLGTVAASLVGALGGITGMHSFDMGWVGDFRISLGVDPFRALLLAFIYTFLILNGVYLLRFLGRVKHPWLYASFTLVAFASANAVVMSRNILVLLIGWEMFLASLYALILSGGEKAQPVAFKALLIGGASDFLMILGLMLYLGMGGNVAMDAAPIATDGSFGQFMSFFLLFLGAGAKAGMWPFQTWIPQAAETMPAPAFAALPASLEKLLGVTFLFTLVKSMYALGPIAQTVMFVFALVTVFAAVIPALVEKNFKKVLALTAISPVGFMVAGLATHVAIGMAGALMYMITHATYKSAMFYAAGNLDEAAGGETLEAIAARPTKNLATVLGFTGAFLAAISFFFTGGFLAKEAILEGAVHHHHYGVFALLVVGAALNVAVMIKLLGVLWSGMSHKAAGDASPVQVIPVVLLGLLSLLGGVVFLMAGHAFDAFVGDGVGEAIHHGFTHPFSSPLVLASGAIWVCGLAMALGLRGEDGKPASTFDRFSSSPVLGRGYELAGQGAFDAYEWALKGIQALAAFVFTALERKIDGVGMGLINAGGGFFRAALSGIHNGIYSNYLAWVLAGFALVAALVLLR